MTYSVGFAIIKYEEGFSDIPFLGGASPSAVAAIFVLRTDGLYSGSKAMGSLGGNTKTSNLPIDINVQHRMEPGNVSKFLALAVPAHVNIVWPG